MKAEQKKQKINSAEIRKTNMLVTSGELRNGISFVTIQRKRLKNLKI
jgi:hypothetical protein